MDRETAPAGAGPLPIFEDGFGTRWLAFDAESGDAVELLSLAPRLVEAPGFAEALGERVARLARNRHMSYARVRRLDRPSEDSLLLVSDRVPGWRLSEVLQVIKREGLLLDVSAIIGLMRQLIPVAAMFSRQQRDAANGTIGPERLILTPNGRLVIADYVLGPAVEKLQLSRERLWRELRIGIPHSATGSKLPPAADVVGMAVVALSLVLGRPLKDDEFLVSLGDLLDLANESSGGTPRPLSPGFRDWLGRSFQFEQNTALQTPQDAQVAFEEMLAKERGYVTSPALLESFIAKLQSIIGSPPVPQRPVAPPPPEPEPEPEPEPVYVRPPSAVRAPVEPPAPPPPPPAPAMPVAQAPPPSPAPSFAPEPMPSPAPPPEPVAVMPTLEPVTAPAFDAAPVAATAAPAADASGVRKPVDSGGKKWMSAALALLAILAVVEGAVIAWMMTRENAPALTDRGELVVRSRPQAARVVIDGEEKGITPYNAELSPGTHILEVRVGRAEPRVIPVQIRAGVESNIYVELQSVATVGALDIRSDPAKAKVTVDGQPRGVTPLVIRDLPPGDHEVLIEAGTRQVRQTVRIEPGITSQLVVPLGSR